MRSGYWRAEEVIQRIGEPAAQTAIPNREHLSVLREPHLQAIARQVGFEYARLSKASSHDEAMRDSRFASAQAGTDRSLLVAGGGRACRAGAAFPA